MQITDIVQANINDTTVTPQAGDFGTLAIVTVNATWPELSRTYSSIAGVLADWPADSPEAIEASKAFAQKKAPKTIKIIRGTHKPTQQYSIAVSAVRNSDSTSYRANVIGQGVTAMTAAYTSDSSATNDEIAAGLAASMNTAVGRNFTAEATGTPTAEVVTVIGDAPTTIASTAFTVDASTDAALSTAHGLATGHGPMQLTTTTTLPGGLALVTNYWAIVVDANHFKFATSRANALAGTFVDITDTGTGTHHYAGNSPRALAPGAWFSIEVLDRTALSVSQTHVDPGIATDLAAIRLVDDQWYTFVTLYNSKALVLGAAAWAEAEGDVAYFPQVNDTTAAQTAVQNPLDQNHDTLQALAALSYNRSVGAWHPSPASGFASGWNGRTLPIRAGSESWDAKDLSAVAPANLTETEFQNLKARKATVFVTVAGLNITIGGTTAGGKAFGIVRGLAWWKDDLQTSILAAKVAADKLEFEDTGVARIEATCRSSTKRAIDRKIIAKNPKPTFSFPLVADISPSDKANRVLNAPNAINATLSGEIDTISLDVNVSF